MKPKLKCPPFAPPLYLQTGHQQTFFMASLWQPPSPPEAEVLHIPIAHKIALRVLLNRQGSKNKACLILVHGLEGCEASAYMLSGATKALKLGLDVIRMNLRSCGPSKHLSRSTYHGGLSSDVYKIAEYAHQILGYEQIVLLGFSLGGHLVLKLAGECPKPPEWLKAVAAISPPLLLEEASEGIMRKENYVYERYFFRRMQKSYRARRRWWPEETDLKALQRARNLREFDELITGPGHGFANAKEYYQACSALGQMNNIHLPTRIIIAADDPIIPLESHLQAMKSKADSVEWLLCSQGGHVGFFNSKHFAQADHDAYWAENRAIDFLLAQMQND